MEAGSEGRPGSTAGWAIGQSAAQEIDAALEIVSNGGGIISLSNELAELALSVPDDWKEQWRGMLGEPSGSLFLMEHLAEMAGVFFEPDYETATLAMRETTTQDALERTGQQAARYGLDADLNLPPPDRLANLALCLRVAVYRDAGFDMAENDDRSARWARELAVAVRALRDGDLHGRLWQRLDRFYYEFYRPWRSTRAEAVDRNEKKAMAVLGRKEADGEPPDLSWLPTQSPLLRYPELYAAVTEGRFRVFFWADPFGLADAWSLLPGVVAISFSEPGALYENFMGYVAGVASRAHALADPTRLTILRIIRNFGMINTEIANFLDISRPTVSIHVKILRDAGLVTSHQVGREMRHEAVPSEVRRLFHDLERFLDLPPEEGIE